MDVSLVSRETKSSTKFQRVGEAKAKAKAKASKKSDDRLA